MMNLKLIESIIAYLERTDTSYTMKRSSRKGCYTFRVDLLDTKVEKGFVEMEAEKNRLEAYLNGISDMMVESHDEEGNLIRKTYYIGTGAEFRIDYDVIF